MQETKADAVQEMPLPTLLAHALTAFTVELDNEFERRLIQPTGQTFATWKREVFLVSLVMWSNYLRHLADGAKTVAELGRFACRDEPATKSALNGLTRWRYVTVSPPAASGRKPPFREWLVEPTPVGERCLAIWAPLPDLIEARWRTRFGEGFARMHRALVRVVRQRNPPGPDYLPILSSRRAMYTEIVHATQGIDPASASFFALLARPLLAFTLDFEAESALALPPCANALRVLDGQWVPTSGLPGRTGVSKEGVAQLVNLLERGGLAEVGPRPGARGKFVRLTSAGLAGLAGYRERLNRIERSWAEELGGDAVAELRNALSMIVVTRKLAESPLAEGLRPHPCTWRALRPQPEVLPEHPLVLGRGGWPDAS